MAVALDGSTCTKEEEADSYNVSVLCCQGTEELSEATVSTDTVPRAVSYCPCAAAFTSSLMRSSAVRDLGGGRICTATLQEQPCKLSETFLKLPWRSKGCSLGRRKRWPPDRWCHRFSFHILSSRTQLFPHPF